MTRDSLLALGRFLKSRRYRFVTPTPATIARVNARPENEFAIDLAGAFGWNRPFPATLLDSGLLAALEKAGVIAPDAGLWRSRVRASTLDDEFYLHSGFPTEATDSVFFGPDSYRFARLIETEMGAFTAPPRRILDLGCGSGVGGLHAARLAAEAAAVTLSDINRTALALAEINAALAGLSPRLVESDLYAALEGPFDLILANPPYMMDSSRRAYRDGGDRLGAGLSLRLLADSLPHLAPGGRLVLYTGSAIRGGEDGFRAAIEPLLERELIGYTYREIDPDVFGEELDQPAYRGVERIAVVALTVINVR